MHFGQEFSELCSFSFCYFYLVIWRRARYMKKTINAAHWSNTHHIHVRLCERTSLPVISREFHNPQPLIRMRKVGRYSCDLVNITAPSGFGHAWRGHEDETPKVELVIGEPAINMEGNTCTKTTTAMPVISAKIESWLWVGGNVKSNLVSVPWSYDGATSTRSTPLNKF